MTSTLKSRTVGRVTAALLAATIASSGALAIAPTAALAVPAGGYADLVATVSPSVVFIEVTSKVTPASADNAQMEEFMRRFGGQMPQMPQEQARQSLGSGFIISSSGEIVTNNHVVADAQTVKVKLSDGRTFDAKVLGTDPMTDLALIKIDAGEALPAIKFGDSSKIRVGDEAIAVGNPFGLGGTVTSGIISATSRDINSGPYDNFIQTDAAINRGNSGGPLFDAQGEVIGVNTAIFSPDGGSVGIGFAVPSNMVEKVVAGLEKNGKIDRGWLGVQIKPMSDEVASALGYDKPMGAVVQAVQPDSPASKAGLKEGDIILSFAGTQIKELRDLTRSVADKAPDSVEKVVVLRKGAKKTLEVTLGNLAAPKA
jgi:serine protease Do